MPVRDPHHRNWNDAKNAISDAGLWFVVLLMRVVFNMPYGPWEGSAWFSKIKTMAEGMFDGMTSADPLFSALYEQICTDMHREATGTPEDKEAIWNIVCTGNAYAVK